MSAPAQRLPYVVRDPALGRTSLAPLLPLTLESRQSVAVTGLLDTGAAVNVLPLSLGSQLGFLWQNETRTVQLSGNLAAVDARVVVVNAVVVGFAPVRLAFAWAQSDEVPVIFGQVNFFLEFDVCIFRSHEAFEVRPKS